MTIVPVIMAGGSGTRLWPLSREDAPKQFQPLLGPLSTYQLTLKRISDASLFEAPVVITAASFADLAERQAAEVGASPTLLLEPERRDSAAAVAAASVFIEGRRPGALVMALAADHVVLDDAEFLACARRGIPPAEGGGIVVFGLAPTEPKTSYGYIRPGAPLGADPDVLEVAAFIEKPELEAALRYMADGYLWNSGNLLFRSDAMLGELAALAPDLLAPVRAAMEGAEHRRGRHSLAGPAFAAAPKTSIDYAVLEKAERVAVVRCRFGWSDLGAWDAIWQLAGHDEGGNAVEGNAVVVEARDCLVRSEGILTAAFGVEGLVVVTTAEAVLVTRRDRAQDLKVVIERLAGDRRREVETRGGPKRRSHGEGR